MPRKVVKKERGVFEKIPGSGIWWIRFKHEGLERREKVGNRGDAIKLYRDRKTAIARAEKLPQTMREKNVTLTQIGQDAIDWYVRQKKKDVRTFSGRMHIIMNSPLGHKAADRLDHNDIESWMLKQGTAKEWEPGTFNRYKTTFSKAYSLALRSKKVTHNPARLVDNRPEDNERARYLSPEESVKLWSVVRQKYPAQVPALAFALNTGARKSEQFKLTWGDVNLEQRQVTLRKTKNGKTRRVQINNTLLNALKSIKRSDQHDNVFAATRGKGDKPLQDPRKWFDTSVAVAGIKDFTWHDLRHDFISHLVMKGVSLAIVGKIAGHGDPKVTGRYAHLAPTTVQRAVDLLDVDEYVIGPEEREAIARLELPA